MVNLYVLQGRLTRDVETKTVGDASCCNFTVAWSEKYKDKETQLFMDCQAWRGTADFISKYFTKGQEIIVVGKCHTEKWQDKDGNNRSTIRMTVDTANFAGSKSDGNGGGGRESLNNNSAFNELDAGDGDLPF